LSLAQVIWKIDCKVRAAAAPPPPTPLATSQGLIDDRRRQVSGPSKSLPETLVLKSPLPTVPMTPCSLAAQPGSQKSLYDPEKRRSSCVLPSYWQLTLTALALQLPWERATVRALRAPEAALTLPTTRLHPPLRAGSWCRWRQARAAGSHRSCVRGECLPPPSPLPPASPRVTPSQPAR
jgi:hypothetical protein